jgi:hypothetical protein
MMHAEPSRLTTIESRKIVIFDEIVRHVARQNEVPIIAAAWDNVLEHIECEVEALLIRPMAASGQPTPEVEAMIEVWRRLENEARKLRAECRWNVPSPMVV